MAKIQKNYFGQTIRNLQWAGILINDIENPILKYFYHAYAGFVLGIFVYFYTIAEIISLYENRNNMHVFLFTLSYLMGHLIGCAKITVLLLRRKSIRNFLQSIEEGRFLPNIERGGLQEIKLIKAAISTIAIQMKTFWIIVFIMLSNRIIWIIKNPTREIISPEDDNVTITIRQLPYSSSYIINFDRYKSPFYELVFIHQVVGIWSFGWYMCNADCITNGLMIHLTAQFKILSNAFNTVIERAQRLTEKCSNINPLLSVHKIKVQYKNLPSIQIEAIPKYKGLFLKNLKKCLVDCIQHHQDLLNLSQNMEDTFSLMLLMQFVGCLMVYTFQLYQLSLMPITSTSFVSMCFFLFAMIFQLLLLCWNGNELSIASEVVANSVYNSEWVPTDSTIQTYIQMVIKRAQKPVYITAGKFSTLSMATFATILRGSASYFMVLREVNEEEEPC